MPEEFDPAWEYWTPDPEIAELLDPPAGGLDALGVNPLRSADAETPTGFRFGVGNPDRFTAWVKGERTPKPPPVVIPEVECGRCGKTFCPDRPGRRYCSVGCSSPAVAESRRVERLGDGCPVCGQPVPPSAKSGPPRRFCSRRCQTIQSKRTARSRQKESVVSREPLPPRRKSVTAKVRIGQPSHTFYLTVGLYDDGRPGEVWIDASKEGTLLRGVLGTLARTISIALQNGCPLSELCLSLKGITFPPNGPVEGSDAVTGCSSVADWIAQELEALFPDTQWDTTPKSSPTPATPPESPQTS